MNRVCFSSLRSDWRTPRAFYQALDAEFHFDYDPCPTVPSCDGLTSEWGMRNYCNPPYGRQIAKWVRKAHEQAAKGRLCVLLVPSRTDTVWWHDHCMCATEIRFIRGRLKFRDAKNNAPFPSAIVIFAPSSPPEDNQHNDGLCIVR